MSKIILGLDPSLSSTGYSIVEVDEDRLDDLEPPSKETLFDDTKNYRPKLVTYGVIETSSNDNLCLRNKKARDRLRDIIEKYKPDLISCEDQYSSLNPGTLKKLSHIRGQFMSLAEDYKIPFYIYYPSSAKKIFSGSGNAGKDDMIEVANRYFGLSLIKKSNPDHTNKEQQDNEADAIALALSYLLNKDKATKL
jgi:Holliday junction resolvasome RuvABC endonuclease subunit